MGRLRKLSTLRPNPHKTFNNFSIQFCWIFKKFIIKNYSLYQGAKAKRVEKGDWENTFFIPNTLLIHRGLGLIHFSIIMSTIITSCQRSVNPMENLSPIPCGRRKFSISRSTQFFILPFFRLQWDRYERDNLSIFAIYTIFDIVCSLVWVRFRKELL